MEEQSAIGTSNQSLNDRFHRHFQSEAASIATRVDQIASKTAQGGERQDAVEHCLAAISQLSDDVSEASGYLPAYDQRACSNTIKTLSEKLQGVRSAVAPKPKFSFKSARKIKASGSPDTLASPQAAPIDSGIRDKDAHDGSSHTGDDPTPAATDAGIEDVLNERIRDASASGLRKPSFSQTNRVVLSNHAGIHIVLPPSALHATGASVLKDLARCVVDLSIPSTSGQTFAALTLQDIRDSLVICGKVSGPIHITNVSNSVIVTACRQFRMHDCRDVDIYLHCASRPIIEDCQGLRFAPLPHNHYSEVLQGQKNYWNQVDDFKWLKSEPNPHWIRLTEEQQIAPSIWSELIPGGPGIGVDDILAIIKTLPYRQTE